MRKTYKFRLYPNKSQSRLLYQNLEECRWVYNETLSARKNAWEQNKETLSLYNTNALLTNWKKERSELMLVHSQVLQNAQERVDLAYKAFFSRVKHKETPGYPRFKGKDRYDSFTFKQSGFKLIENKLRISKIGDVKIWMHRKLDGKVKTLTIRVSQTKKWYACFSCEIDGKPLPENTKAVGIDVGLEKFAALSTGEYIDNPRFFRLMEKKLIEEQRKRDKLPKGSEEKNKQSLYVSHIHEKIANRRSDFAHKLSRKLVNEFGIIVFEKLNIDRMVLNHHLAKSISDASWNQLIQFTAYKAVEAGRSVVLVDPRNTSKKCSRCGTLVEKKLSDRIHSCPVCNIKIDRDLNAAYNILGLGLQSLASSKSLLIYQ